MYQIAKELFIELHIQNRLQFLHLSLTITLLTFEWFNKISRRASFVQASRKSGGVNAKQQIRMLSTCHSNGHQIHITCIVRCVCDVTLGLNLCLSDLAEIVGFWIAIFLFKIALAHLNKIYFQFAILKLNLYICILFSFFSALFPFRPWSVYYSHFEFSNTNNQFIYLHICIWMALWNRDFRIISNKLDTH